MTRFILLLTMLMTICAVHTVHAQTDISLPTILSPSPEAMSIVRGNALSLTKNTGAATASIPLHEIKVKGFSLPIALGYASCGVKIDAIPGRVGTDWSLTAGGVVTRVVHGLPDDESSRVTAYPTFDNGFYNRGLIYYLAQLTGTNNKDAEPDEFNVAAPGISAKFILDSNGTVMQLPHSNLRIEVAGGPWAGGGKFSSITVTNTEGTVYYFGGGATERTSSPTAGPGGFNTVKTGFFLKKIKTSVGDSILYNYETVGSENYTGVNFYVKLPQRLNETFTCNTQPCTGVSGSYLDGNLSIENTLAVYLSSIIVSDGTVVNFTYEPRQDESTDNRLKFISVSNGHKIIKSFRCAYADYETPIGANGHESGNHNRRFFLDTVISYASGDPAGGEPYPVDSLTTTLEYYSPSFLPARLSYGQDHWGYYNGKTNPNLLPLTAGINPIYASANREADSAAAIYGLLKKIIFPTGGFQEFILEPNKQTNYERLKTEVEVSVDGSSHTTAFETFYSVDTLKVKSAITATFTLNAFQNPGCYSCTPTPPNTVTFLRAQLIDATTGEVLETNIMRTYNEYQWVELLDSGRNYILKLSVKDAANAGSFTVKYDTAAMPIYHYVDKQTGGLRVKQIMNYDPVTDAINNIYYKYTASLDTNFSSIISTYGVKYLTNSTEPSTCERGLENTMIPLCYFTTLSSFSLMGGCATVFENSYFAYTSIIEFNSPDYKTGSTKHEYFVYPTDPLVLAYGESFNNIPTDIISGTNGKEFKTTYFDSSKRIVRKEEYFYAEHPDAYYREYNAIAVRSLWDYNLTSNADSVRSDGWLSSFDAAQYRYVSNWVRLDSTIETTYDDNDNTLAAKTIYGYGDYNNIQPLRTISFSNAGDSLITVARYPTNFSATAPYDKMIRRNIINLPVENIMTRAGTQVKKLTTVYKDWYADSSLFKPEYVKLQRTSADPDENRLHFYNYDVSGNLLEVSKENDVKHSYIWDYTASYPVAEIENGSYASTSYSSFEADGKGNWDYTVGVSSDAGSVTGEKAFVFGGSNTIERTALDTAVSYIVTYWLKNGTGTPLINSGGGATSLSDKNGWTLYQKEISHVSSVLFTGTGVIDELRMYPKGAQMTTYTYEPLVGITSQCNANNIIMYYEYDSFNRLKYIRDIDKNILKKLEYKYREIQ
jgi:hypothetical protein